MYFRFELVSGKIHHTIVASQGIFCFNIQTTYALKKQWYPAYVTPLLFVVIICFPVLFTLSFMECILFLGDWLSTIGIKACGTIYITLTRFVRMCCLLMLIYYQFYHVSYRSCRSCTIVVSIEACTYMSTTTPNYRYNPPCCILFCYVLESVWVTWLTFV